MKISKYNTVINKIKLIISHLLSRRFKPYSLNSELHPGNNYSDLFIYVSRYDKISFIAENTYALFKGEPIEVKHVINLYSKDGLLIESFEKKSDLYICEIKLPRIKRIDKYISFTHKVEICNWKSMNKEDYKELMKLNLLHRGYVNYQRGIDSLGSIVHGNFGGVCTDSVMKPNLS